MRIGIAGFGHMGSTMADRLKYTGAEVAVWNSKPEKVQGTNFIYELSPYELARSCDVVISTLFDDNAINSVFTGKEGLLAGSHGKLLIEMSTAAPSTQKALAIEAAAAGATLIECPVSGSTAAVRSGTLFGMAGGVAADVERALPVLERLCRSILHVGPIGTGAIAKLAVNLPLLAFWQAFSEAISLLERVGKDPKWMVDLFRDTAGAPAVLKGKADSIVSALSGNDGNISGLQIQLMRKDLLLMMAEADISCISLPVAKAALSAFDEAVSAGFGKRDCAWMPAYWVSRQRYV